MPNFRLFFILFVFPISIAILYIVANSKLDFHKVESTPVITVSDGPIQGHVKYSRDGKKYWHFGGIPYAKAPIGDLLFKPPVPVEPWEHVKQVTSFPPNCAQYDALISLEATGEMDCLFLNVFVNVDNEKTRKKPVLVYIHGGAFISGGSEMYQPEFFMDQEIVLVVINYRLGPYGFLNLQNLENNKEEKVPQGNMGFLDQRLALKWIQQNIARFGGDPNKVTLFGESAGAISAHLHLLSPMSRGLFHRVILQSASALPHWMFSRKPYTVAVNHAKKMGCPVNNSKDLLGCFQTTDWKQLVKYQNCMLDPLMPKHMFAATLDGSFLTKWPHDILKSGEFPPIPIMFGMNSGEGGIRAARLEAIPELIPKLDEKWAELIGNLMILDEPLPPNTSMEIKAKYFGNKKFTDDFQGFRKNISEMLSDSGFFHPNHMAAVYHARNGAQTYMYYFNYSSKAFPGLYGLYSAQRMDDWLPAALRVFWNLATDWITQHVFGGIGPHDIGISHGEDVLQQWNIFGISKFISWRDYDFSHSFVKSIVDFANGTTPLTYRGVEWSPINEHLKMGKSEYSMPYMLMDNQENSGLVPEPFGERIKFWTDLEGHDY